MYYYNSDFKKFMDDYLEKHSQEKEQRVQNRAKLWDVKLNLVEQEDFQKSNIDRKPYMFQSYDG